MADETMEERQRRRAREAAASMQAAPANPLLTEGRSRIRDLPVNQVRLMLAGDIQRSRLRQHLDFDLAEGQLGLGKQFAALAGGQFLYSEAERLWLHYDAARGIWLPGEADARERVKALAGAVMDAAREQMVRAAQSGVQAEQQAARVRFALATSLQKERTIGATLDVARTAPGLRISGPGDFDQDPDLLCVENGVVDLRSGTLLPHSPDRRMRKRVRARFDPDATCPRWLSHIEAVTCGDDRLAAYLKRALGYSVTGHVTDEVMFFLFGHGANGKSVTINVVEGLLGDYCVRAGGEFLMMANGSSSREGATPVLATFPGARIVLVNEVESGAQLSPQQVKVLVSTERITARRLYRDPITFSPTHKLWVRGNHKPVVRDTDHGLWRRLHLVPFLRQFSKEEADPDLARKLLAEESSGILAWICRGAQEWYAAGKLHSTEAVNAATQEYRSDSDFVAQWIAERCTRGPDKQVVATQAYASHRDWSEQAGVRPLSQPVLTRRLAEIGISVIRKRTDGGAPVRYYVGLAVGF